MNNLNEKADELIGLINDPVIPADVKTKARDALGVLRSMGAKPSKPIPEDTAITLNDLKGLVDEAFGRKLNDGSPVIDPEAIVHISITDGKTSFVAASRACRAYPCNSPDGHEGPHEAREERQAAWRAGPVSREQQAVKAQPHPYIGAMVHPAFSPFACTCQSAWHGTPPPCAVHPSGLWADRR
jgi:hypothetical protein